MKRLLLLSVLAILTGHAFGQNQETLKINWPDEYKWKIGADQKDGTQQMIEIIPGNESIDKWTIIGTMLSIKDVHNVPMDAAMNLMFDQAKKDAISPTLTLIEKNDTATSPWIIFKIEASGFQDDKTPESQLYYIIQGKAALYSNFIAIKEKRLPEEFVIKWTKIFKNSELTDK
jgi:hypothetical protein